MASPSVPRHSFHFALFSFSGAFLLFFVQPMAGKALLLAFGGTAAVWTHCLLFFQSALLAGYLYAHALGRLPDVRKQLRIHLLFCTVGILWTGLSFVELRPLMEEGTSETASLLLWLAKRLGIPYVLLSATSPLTQQWFTARFPGRDPYSLFAWSNAGSFLALLAYPFVLEPLVGLEFHRIVWIIGLLACVALVDQIRRAFSSWERAVPTAIFPGEERIDGVTAGLWVLLPAVGTAALVAFTQALTHEVAPMPFLWVLPLSLYLLSFVLPFDKRHLYARKICGPLLSKPKESTSTSNPIPFTTVEAFICSLSPVSQTNLACEVFQSQCLALA